MLVEINLLPQKEEKKRSLLLILIIGIAILLIGGFALYWFNRTTNQAIEQMNESIASSEQIIATEQQKIVEFESSNSLAELENTVAWARDYPIKTVPVIEKLTSYLPDRGFIQNFKYEETGMITLSVQFETSRDSAYYLTTLLESNWISDAKLNKLEAVTAFYDKKLGEEMDETKIKNEKYVPRYQGEYEITLNRNVVKEDIKKKSSESEASDKKGGEDS